MRDQHIDERIILKYMFKKIWYESGDWFELAQELVQWLAFVNMVMNIGFLKRSKFHDQLAFKEDLAQSAS